MLKFRPMITITTLLLLLFLTPLSMSAQSAMARSPSGDLLYEVDRSGSAAFSDFLRDLDRQNEVVFKREMNKLGGEVVHWGGTLEDVQESGGKYYAKVLCYDPMLAVVLWVVVPDGLLPFLLPRSTFQFRGRVSRVVNDPEFGSKAWSIVITSPTECTILTPEGTPYASDGLDLPVFYDSDFLGKAVK